MKPFNLEEYLKNSSKKVITRNGKAVKIHCTDYIGAQHIIAKIENYRYSTSFYNDGKYCSDKSVSPLDLFFAPEKHEGWINIFKSSNDIAFLGQSRIFESKKDAKKERKDCECYVATVKIEWEE